MTGHWGVSRLCCQLQTKTVHEARQLPKSRGECRPGRVLPILQIVDGTRNCCRAFVICTLGYLLLSVCQCASKASFHRCMGCRRLVSKVQLVAAAVIPLELRSASPWTYFGCVGVSMRAAAECKSRALFCWFSWATQHAQGGWNRPISKMLLDCSTDALVVKRPFICKNFLDRKRSGGLFARMFSNRAHRGWSAMGLWCAPGVRLQEASSWLVGGCSSPRARFEVTSATSELKRLALLALHFYCPDFERLVMDNGCAKGNLQSILHSLSSDGLRKGYWSVQFQSLLGLFGTGLFALFLRPWLIFARRL